MTKYCKDCKFFYQEKFLGIFPTDRPVCKHPKFTATDVNVVFGIVSNNYYMCYTMRGDSSFGGHCGQEARFFEPKKKWWPGW